MNVKIFSYIVPGIILEQKTEELKVSKVFNRKTILNNLKEDFKLENYKIDESSLSFKIKDNQIFIEGLAIENEEPKKVGFHFGG